MSREVSTVFINLDIGQTISDGGLQYFREQKGQYSFKDPLSLAMVYDSFAPLPFASEGVSTLADAFQFGAYYTVRPYQLLDQAVEWLQRYKFPHPRRVHICKNNRDKVDQIICHQLLSAEQSHNGAVIVDDHGEALIRELERLVAEEPEWRFAAERLLVVQFGKNHFFSLPYWDDQNVQALITDINALYFDNSSLSKHVPI